MLVLTNCEVHTAKYSDVFGKFGKTNEILLEAQFCEDQAKNFITKSLKYFSENVRRVLGKFRRIAGDSHLNKYWIILIPHFSQVHYS